MSFWAHWEPLWCKRIWTATGFLGCINHNPVGWWFTLAWSTSSVSHLCNGILKPHLKWSCWRKLHVCSLNMMKQLNSPIVCVIFFMCWSNPYVWSSNSIQIPSFLSMSSGEMMWNALKSCRFNAVSWSVFPSFHRCFIPPGLALRQRGASPRWCCSGRPRGRAPRPWRWGGSVELIWLI